MANDLAAGIAVVTGAGSGLGRALAAEFVRRGVTVAGLGRQAEALRQTADLTGAGNRFVPLVADVADPGHVAAAFAALDALDRPVTILVNNAAVYERFDFLERPPDAFMRAVAVNLGGVVNCSHEALRRMTAHGFGRILNVATFADLGPQPGSAAYSVSKGAARIFTRALVADAADRFPDIVIGDWAPGVLATPMGLPDGLDPARAAKWGVDLALRHDRTLTGTIFDRDLEHLERPSLKRRIANMMLLQPGRKPRRLAGG